MLQCECFEHSGPVIVNETLVCQAQYVSEMPHLALSATVIVIVPSGNQGMPNACPNMQGMETRG